MCDQGPALLVNGRAIPALTAERIRQIGDLVLARTPLADWPAEFFQVQDNVQRADLLLDSRVRRRRCHPCRAPARYARLVRTCRQRTLLARIVRRRGAGSRRDAGGDQALQPARPRWRGLHDGHQVGSLPPRDRHVALCRVQCRRGRARHVQGPRAAGASCGPALRRHDGGRVRGRRGPGFRVPARRIPLPARVARGDARTPPPRAPARQRHLRRRPGSTSTSASTSGPARTSAARNRR